MKQEGGGERVGGTRGALRLQQPGRKKYDWRLQMEPAEAEGVNSQLGQQHNAIRTINISDGTYRSKQHGCP